MVHSNTACRAMSAEPQMSVLKERDSLSLCYCTPLCFQVAFLQCALNLGVIKAFCWSEFCSLSFIKPGTDHPSMPTTHFFSCPFCKQGVCCPSLLQSQSTSWSFASRHWGRDVYQLPFNDGGLRSRGKKAGKRDSNTFLTKSQVCFLLWWWSLIAN